MLFDGSKAAEKIWLYKHYLNVPFRLKLNETTTLGWWEEVIHQALLACKGSICAVRL